MPSRTGPAAFFAAAMALLLLPSLTAAQTSRDVITRQLERADALAAAQGLRLDDRALSSSQVVGLLEGGAAFMVEVQLESSAEYLIEGFCDEDCTDIDLTLYGEDAEPVASDVEVDDVPELRFQASRTGPHYLRVSLVDCSADQCYYAVRVLRK